MHRPGVGAAFGYMRRWRGRFAQAGLPGLKDRQRCGLSASFTPLRAADDKVLACRLPAESEVPLSRWSCPEPAREAAPRGVTPFMPASTVRRWQAQDALKPWQHRCWTFITSPGLWLKAAWVLDLYARTWQGERLGDDEYVIYFSAVQRKAASPTTSPTSPRSGTASEPAKTATTPRRSRSSGGSPPWTICWPGSTGIPPITTKNPLSHRQREQTPEGLTVPTTQPCRPSYASWAAPGQSVRDLYRKANQRNRHEAEREDDLRQDWDEEQRHEVLEEQEPCRQEE